MKNVCHSDFVMRVTALLPHPDATVGALSVQWLVKLFSVFSKASFMHLLTIFVLSLVVSASMSNSTLDNYIVEDCELNFFFSRGMDMHFGSPIDSKIFYCSIQPFVSVCSTKPPT